MFSDEQLRIIHVCSVECEFQQSGERSVSWMLEAWNYAMSRTGLPTMDDVLTLARLIEPVKNKDGFRKPVPEKRLTGNVSVGSSYPPDWSLVPELMADLMQGVDHLSPEDFFLRFEEIHGFFDGNGRTGLVLHNWLADSLHAPTRPPNFFHDPRRTAEEGGAPVSRTEFPLLNPEMEEFFIGELTRSRDYPYKGTQREKRT